MTLSARDRKLLAFLVPIVLIVLFYLLVISPRRDDISGLDGQISAAGASLVAAQGKLDAARAAQSQFAQNVQELSSVGQAVPGDSAVPQLLTKLESTAQSLGLDLTAVGVGGTSGSSPATASTTSTGGPAGVSSNSVTLTLQGTYFQAETFLQHVQQFIQISGQQVQATGRLLSISNVTLGNGQGGFPHLNVQLSATVYSLPNLDTQLAQLTATGGAS